MSNKAMKVGDKVSVQYPLLTGFVEVIGFSKCLIRTVEGQRWYFYHDIKLLEIQE